MAHFRCSGYRRRRTDTTGHCPSTALEWHKADPYFCRKHLLGYIREKAAEGEIYVSLNADPPGRRLYQLNGFIESAELDETGMVLLIEKGNPE